MRSAATSGIIVVMLASACSERTSPERRGAHITVAPLELSGIDYACYDISVTGPSGLVVRLGDPNLAWVDGDDETVCSWQYGNGRGGDIAYVAPCDADDGDGESPARADNAVTLWFDGLYRDRDGDHDPDEDVDVGQWQDPCPGGCSVSFECVEDRDVEVALSFVVMREANQGFFDVAVDFDDIFCSAKLDCVPELLHDPATGLRGPTVVLGLACTAGQGSAGEAQSTWLYLDDLRIECTQPAKTYTFDPTDGPGQVGGQAPGVFQVSYFRGHEDLPGLEKCYWNASFGLDVETLADPGVLEGDCWLRARGTASQLPFVGGHTPPATVYPVIDWNVRLSDESGALICGSNPLNGTGSGVQTVYTALAGETFTCGMACGTGAIDCAGAIACPGAVPALAGGSPSFTQNAGAVTLHFQGQDYPFTIDPAYTLSACCGDGCCASGVSP